MKGATVAVCGILLASVAWPEDVTVHKELKPQESSSHARIMVVLEGRPLKGVKVDFYEWIVEQGVGQPYFSGLTDDSGIATPPDLSPGDYHVFATLDDDVRTVLWLHVVRKREALTTLSMDLTESVQLARQMQDAAVRRAERVHSRDRLRAFQGIVVDPSGAPIAGAKIRIMKSGAIGTVLLRLEADANGRFAAQLTDGPYLGFFYFEGFRIEAVPFDVTKEGSGDLRVMLQVGHT